MTHIAVIPARAGSVRFPGKNRALLAKIPLWKWATAITGGGGISRTIINTDDLEIPHSRFRLWEIYERPENLRDGMSYRIDDVMIEMAKTLHLEGDCLHLIQCTSPFITPEHIKVGIDLLNKERIDSVQLVAPIPNTLHAYSQRIVKDGFISFGYPEEREKCYNSQRKPIHYQFCGYVGFRVDSLLKNGNIWGHRSMPIVGTPECAIDIDTPEDLELAEFYLRRKGYASSFQETEKGHGDCRVSAGQAV